MQTHKRSVQKSEFKHTYTHTHTHTHTQKKNETNQSKTRMKKKSWQDVAYRVEKVYCKALQKKSKPLLDRLQLYYAIGPISGLHVMFFACIYYVSL